MTECSRLKSGGPLTHIFPQGSKKSVHCKNALCTLSIDLHRRFPFEVSLKNVWPCPQYELSLPFFKKWGQILSFTIALKKIE